MCILDYKSISYFIWKIYVLSHDKNKYNIYLYTWIYKMNKIPIAFIGCFNDDKLNTKLTNVVGNEKNDISLDKCKELAYKNNSKFFGMRDPIMKTDGNAISGICSYGDNTLTIDDIKKEREIDSALCNLNKIDMMYYGKKEANAIYKIVQ